MKFKLLKKHTKFSKNSYLFKKYIKFTVRSDFDHEIQAKKEINNFFWNFYAQNLEKIVIFKIYTECTNIFTDQVGFIQSHGFPSNYPPNQNCTYKVEAESNTLIVIELKVFRLQNRVSGECKDYLVN